MSLLRIGLSVSSSSERMSIRFVPRVAVPAHDELLSQTFGSPTVSSGMCSSVVKEVGDLA
jgi:hypothetical protein